MSATTKTGGCLCGAVRYELQGPLRPVVACHCKMCRRASGSFVHATAVRREHLHLTDSDALAWYRSSPSAQRGFCRLCGSNLLWQAEGAPHICVMAGGLDDPTGLRLEAHIFAGSKGDYYAIADGARCQDDGDHGVKIPEA